jgi:hypothetical protein
MALILALDAAHDVQKTKLNGRRHAPRHGVCVCVRVRAFGSSRVGALPHSFLLQALHGRHWRRWRFVDFFGRDFVLQPPIGGSL